MPELRKDPIIGRWVIISTERAKRPDQFRDYEAPPPEGECPFCSGHEKMTPPEIYSIRSRESKPNTSGWSVRVVPSIVPLLKIEGDLNRRGDGIYDLMNGVGAHEVIIEAPNHIANIADLSAEQITNIFLTYISRIVDLRNDPRFKYVLIFKNYGWAAGGGRIQHSKSQLIATPVTPKRVKEELVGSKIYYNFHERCIFCDLIQQELKEGSRVILDMDGFIAIAPFASRFPFEVWVLPKKHNCDFVYTDPKEVSHLAKVMKTLLSRMKKILNDPPYNYIIHTAPFRRADKQPGFWKTISQDYHWHIEIMPRVTRVAGFEWGTGFYICPALPEDVAKYLREAKAEWES